MKKALFIIISALLFTGAISAQAQFTEATISFDNLNHNFGNIKEVDGIVEHTFEFKNTGKQALILNAVRASCGCTTPEWSKEPIPPGGSGSIKVSFNPLRRPGAFRKSITVQSNAKTKTTILYIVGLVEAKPKTITDEYPIEVGPIRLSTNHLSVSRVYNNQKKSHFIKIVNTSDKPVTVTIPESPDHLSFQVQPPTLQANQKGSIIGHFDASKIDDWGFITSRIYLYIDGEKFTKKMLAASGSIEEDFSQLSAEEKAQAAKMVLEEESYNFGTIKQGEIIEHDFKFKNEGKQTLLIRKIKTTCGCTASEPSSKEIAPGEEGILHATFNSRAKKGKQMQTITVITNDASQSTHLLRFAGTVEVEQK
jgi:hypothetical protein